MFFMWHLQRQAGYDIYLVWGKVNRRDSLKAEHLCHLGVIA